MTGISASFSALARRPALLVLLAGLMMAAGSARVQAQGAPPQEAQPQAGGSLEQRVRNIEEQVLEIQTMLGTLQSLVRDGGGAAAAQAPAGVSAGALSGDSDQRIRVMETQINALSRQVEQLTSQLNAFSASGTDQSPAGPGAPQEPAPQFGTVTLPPDQQQQAVPQTPPFAQPQQQQLPQWGQTPPLRSGEGQAPSLRSGEGQLGAEGQPGQLGGQPQGAPAGQTAALPPAQARALYDQAYGNLVRRDYASAEQGFRMFLSNFPSDALAGNAQYWLGETYFMRNQYKQAADSFLKAYQRYPNSSKAAESLLRLGTSLAQLGNKEDACATIAEVGRKFPDAADYLKQRAATEARRAGC
ncbi:MAG: tol-pal system protein YbgF [Hyphomicrobiales bacterium]